MLNFISNAVKFTAHGLISLEITSTEDMATVAVSDTGPGVPLADQERIFEECGAAAGRPGATAPVRSAAKRQPHPNCRVLQARNGRETLALLE